MAGLLMDEELMPFFGNPNIQRQSAKARAAADLRGRKNKPNEEAQFQSWIRATPWFSEFVQQYGEEPNLNAPEYDYRAAWRSGVVPERDPYDNNRFHWPSSLPDGKMLKSANHPTAWKENFMRQTGQNPDAIGLNSKEKADAYLRRNKEKKPSGLLD